MGRQVAYTETDVSRCHRSDPTAFANYSPHQDPELSFYVLNLFAEIAQMKAYRSLANLQVSYTITKNISNKKYTRNQTMLNGPIVTTAWLVHNLQMEEKTTFRYGG
jgi:hypothetical protein